MKKNIFRNSLFQRTTLAASILASMAISNSAFAFKIETDNPDFDIRLDNTVRYNLGFRMQDPNDYLLTPSSAVGASEYEFRKKYGTVTNRVDLLSEFDFIYKQTSGFRVSGAAWYDERYNRRQLSGFPTSEVNFPGGVFPHEIARYYNGPSGEILDAFVFHKFNIGEVPVNVKVGQHTVYWGETLFSLADGVSSGQSYADLRKGLATPGVEAKETFKPLNQISFSAQLNPEYALMGQYFLDWKPDLFPLGGTYFSPVDFLTYHGQTIVDPRPGSYTVWNGLQDNGQKKSGDWGLAIKGQPQWLDGTAGLYYREFTPKNSGALGVDPSAAVLTAGAAPTNAALYIDSAAPKTKLFGLSLGKEIGGISWGMDVTYRKDATLVTKPFAYTIGTGWAPIGDVFTATLNMIAYFGKTSIFDSAVLTAELDYDRLRRVTRNAQNFGGEANCASGTTGTANIPGVGPLPLGTPNAGAPNQGNYGCATRSSSGINILFEPKWFQALPGTDISMPLFYSVGLKGNSPVPAVGQNHGQGSYSVGIVFDVDAKYNFALRYNGFLYARRTNSATGVPFTNASLGDFSDRNWLSFTFKTTF